RLLLEPTDPVATLRSTLANALRKALLDTHNALEAAYAKGIASLEASSLRARLSDADRTKILEAVGLSCVGTVDLTTGQALMSTPKRNLRKDSETAVKKARRVAEAGAKRSIEQHAVHERESYPTLSADQRKLRNRLRAHARQLGDKRNEQSKTQAIRRLVSE